LRGINFKSQGDIPIKYKELTTKGKFRYDLLIENILIVELKAINEILPVHEAQLLTYMKLLSLPEGILINFNVTNIFYEGQKTLVNELYKNLKD